MDEPTPHQISAAAVRWCGSKERETFHDDIVYFRENWQNLPGLRAHVELEMIASKHLALRAAVLRLSHEVAGLADEASIRDVRKKAPALADRLRDLVTKE